MKKIFICTIIGIIIGYEVNAQNVKANFTAEECTKEVYKQGFDSNQDLAEWTLTTTNETNTWYLGNSRITGIPPFSSIDPTSINSLAIKYDAKNAQNESITSPEMNIESNSFCTFYACFDGVFVMYANLTIEIINTKTQQKDVLFDALLWSQASGHERPKWQFFKYDLSAYTNQTVQFIITYKGMDGDDALIDNFCIIQESNDETSTANIQEGGQVHFKDTSTGNPTTWEWTFEGGEPATSTEQNPVITYKTSGNYPVKLIAKNANGSNEYSRTDFVMVKGVAPIAAIGWPDEGYLSPYTGIFVPTQTDIHFTDISQHLPTAWKWTLTGSSQPTSTEQNPVVRYNKEGIYDVTLQVANSSGTDFVDYKEVIQAGGKQYIWNIEMQETETLESIYFPFFGYYGGSNWLGMLEFAEHFQKPITQGKISEVSIFFASTSTITPDALITVSIAQSQNGLPGNKLASASIPAKELQYSDDTWLPTDFKFENPVEINEEFFVIVEGIPNNTSDKGTDDIAMLCTARRPDGSKSTVYHLLEEQNDDGTPTGKIEWFKNTDEFLSFAIAPLFTYTNVSSSINNSVDKQQISICPSVIQNQIELFDTNNIENITIYTLLGQQVYQAINASPINVSHLQKGFYIIQVIKDQQKYTQKIYIQ